MAANPRAAAVAALVRQEQDGFSNLVLDAELKRQKLEGRDKAFASAIFYTVLEHRGTLDYESKVVYPDFWQTIFQNLTEVPVMLEYIQENWPDTPIAVMGHSMGGFTALGAVSLFREFKTAVVMNGSGWWDESDRRFRAALHIEKPRAYRFIQMQFAAMDPYTHMDRLSGRSLLSLRGGADDVVDGAAQELYLEKLAQRDDVKTQSIVYDDLGHFVTTNMMGDAVNWLQTELH